MNSLLYSIRGFKVGDPAFTFDYESKGFDRSVWSKVEETSTDSQIHFIASKDFENVNFFQNMSSTYDFSNLKVYINGELTNQVANSISAKAGDDIAIKYTGEGGPKYPWFGYRNRTPYGSAIDYVKSIEEPLPLMYQDNGDPVTDFSSCFSDCVTLESIPAGLFKNNPQVTDLNHCFDSCTGLTILPEGLFDNCSNVTSFQWCFGKCTNLTNIPSGLFSSCSKVTIFIDCFRKCASLTAIPAGLFDNNTQVTNFSYCFEGCSSITAIPEGLFDNNIQVESFSECFQNCSALTSIPLTLFNNNIKVNNVSHCFDGCSLLTVAVQIGSTATSVRPFDTVRFAYNTAGIGTVYCKENSAMYNAFIELGIAYTNVNVLTY
nr:MAG TPA: leucine-rich repeat protein [Caudoviricetes sp.]